MSALINLTGMVFGRLTVLSRVENPKKAIGNTNQQAFWLCRCLCGKETIVRSQSLRTGETTSCGCFHRHIASQSLRTHGKSHTPEHQAYVHIRQRCLNTRDASYHRYGGRGIQCLWASFQDFLKDMGPRPGPQYSIDRIDNNGHYRKENCRWATQAEQMNNMSRNHVLTFNGATRSLSEWSKVTGLNYGTLVWRIQSRWTAERALTTPSDNPLRNPYLTYRGTTLRLNEWARRLGISPATIQYRRHSGWPDEKVFASHRFANTGNPMRARQDSRSC